MKITLVELEKIENAFSALMGVNGESFIDEICTKGYLSKKSYQAVCDNVYYNGKTSITEYFGIVHWYYLSGERGNYIVQPAVEAITDKF